MSIFQSSEAALIDTKQHNARVSVKQEQARFIDSLSSLQFESVTTTEEMVDEDKVRNEIKEEYNKRLVSNVGLMGYRKCALNSQKELLILIKI